MTDVDAEQNVKDSDQAQLYLKPFDFEIVTVNSEGEEQLRQHKQAQAFVEDVGGGITLEMVSIPGGSFQMGSPTPEKFRFGSESPQHEVTVSAFLLGRYAVTQAQYELIMGNNRSNFKGALLPVDTVSWDDAQAFCEKLSEKTERTYRLPSEAEWEYACRAGTTTPFYFGETITTTLANFNGSYTYQFEAKGEYREKTVEVDSLLPNAFGLSNMHGNVWEWCEDIYHKKYDGAPTDGTAWKVGRKRITRVLRGGAWNGPPRFCRSASRASNDPRILYDAYGFRVVCSTLTI